MRRETISPSLSLSPRPPPLLRFKKKYIYISTGKLCIEVSASSKLAWISEELCIGCGICVKKCPFDAIMIINLPKNLERECTHRYGPNSFKLHRLPVPRPGQVLGLVGTNGIGKSTALKVLGGKLKPNLGRFENPPDWQEVRVFFLFPLETLHSFPGLRSAVLLFSLRSLRRKPSTSPLAPSMSQLLKNLKNTLKTQKRSSPTSAALSSKTTSLASSRTISSPPSSLSTSTTSPRPCGVTWAR